MLGGHKILCYPAQSIRTKRDFFFLNSSLKQLTISAIVLEGKRLMNQNNVVQWMRSISGQYCYFGAGVRITAQESCFILPHPRRN